jgi:DNA repair protein RadA/Sms
MVKTRAGFCCSACGAEVLRWSGRCPGCGAWNTLLESRPPAIPGGCGAGRPRPLLRPLAVPTAIGDVDLHAAAPVPTGLAELDRVLGGGLVPGSVTLLGGEPGVGKSTLLLQMLAARAGAGVPALLVCAEESASQVRLRAGRLGTLPDALYVLAETDVTAIPEALVTADARLVVVDSIQAVADPGLGAPAGSVSQVRACAELLVTMAKAAEVPVVLVGHVTKDGALAGPRLLEHLVDTVLSVEGDRHHALRTVRAVKHRFGPTGELGLFEMGDGGLSAVADPYRLLLGDRRPSQPGSSVVAAVEGRRPLLVEVQALVGTSPCGPTGPRRQAQGLDGGRLSVLLAVLDRALGLGLGRTDVFASVVGGVRLSEPAADLAVALAVAGAACGRPVPPDMVAFGEVGLGGELRQVAHAERRLQEAARLGFRRAAVPAGCCPGPAGMRLLRVDALGDLPALLEA